ncbi:MAG: MGH1-like glycoside hydrolase domain-containing protein, partial [Mycobacterium sp.]
MAATPEHARLNEAREQAVPWKKWGPYLSERQWGTVREDYSPNGDAWNFFTHDHARSRAYRWGEDGIAGISDDKQGLCFSLALWNGKDPILKERLFGLTNSEGNHGEDVKEYYFYLDSTPTHSYMKYLYKYPQAAYPYADLVETNRRRTRNDMEYELLDTGVFDDDRYFDVFVEYAKDGPEDILVKIAAANRGPEAAELHLLPTLWFRNDWASWIAESNRAAKKPNFKQIKGPVGTSAVAASHPVLGEYTLYCEGEVPLLFTENETNNERLFPGQPNDSPYVKDGINDCVVQGRQRAVNPEKQGTKAAA